MKQFGLIILGALLAGLVALYWGKPYVESDYDRVIDSLRKERKKVELKIKSQDSLIKISDKEIGRLEGEIASYKADIIDLKDSFDVQIEIVQQQNLEAIIAYIKDYYNTDQVIKVQRKDTLYIGFVEGTVRRMRTTLVEVNKLEAINSSLENQLIASDSLIAIQDVQLINKDSMISLLGNRYDILFDELYECDNEVDFQKEMVKKFKVQRNIAIGTGIVVVIVALL